MGLVLLQSAELTTNPDIRIARRMAAVALRRDGERGVSCTADWGITWEAVGWFSVFTILLGLTGIAVSFGV